MATATPQCMSFNQVVSRILNCWEALKTAVEHGFGGSNSKQKAQDLLYDIEGLFNSNRSIDPYDFADFLEDEMDEKFNLVLEDGSAKMIAGHICQCFTYLKEGRITEVEQFLQGLLEAPSCSRVQFAGAEDSSGEDDDDEEEDMENSSSQPQQHSLQQQQESTPLQNQCSNGDGGACSQSPSTNGGGNAAMDVAEEDDGWTVVKKGGRKR